MKGQFASLDEDLTGYENLLILGRLHGLSRAAGKVRADDLLDAFDLTGAADRPAGHYSGGMRRRLDMGAGLIVTPDLMFLDEPTTGLDPRSRNQVWDGSVGSPPPAPRRGGRPPRRVDRGHRQRPDRGRRPQRPAQVPGRLGLPAPAAHRRRAVSAGAADPGRRLAGDGSARRRSLALSMLLAGPPDATDTGRLVGRAMTQLAEAGVAIADLSLGRPSPDEAFLTLTGRRTGQATIDHEGANA
ncbi:ATP-binding cassette domain-containing protein [Streptomyces sp. SAS_270]|uniref:ATP-binding cassette domain-containing protein n=1 Tax=Streptomyces sp. SAS_270 TaxID=3412748 RepID=UPI00403D3CD2